MKNSARYKFVLLAACASLPAAGLFAQAPAASPAPAATPSVSVPAAPADTAGKPPGKKGERLREAMKERLETLTPEERTKLIAARMKAKDDPAVKAAEATRATDHKGYKEAMRAAMLRADPSIEPILNKMREEHPKKKNL